MIIIAKYFISEKLIIDFEDLYNRYRINIIKLIKENKKFK